MIASIEDQAVIDKILAHLTRQGVLPPPPKLLPAAKAPARLGRVGICPEFLIDILYMPQPKDGLPGGLLSEESWRGVKLSGKRQIQLKSSECYR